MWWIKHNRLLQHADSQYFLIDNDDDTESYILNISDAILSCDADVDDIISLNGPWVNSYKRSEWHWNIFRSFVTRCIVWRHKYWRRYSMAFKVTQLLNTYHHIVEESCIYIKRWNKWRWILFTPRKKWRLCALWKEGKQCGLTWK